MWFDVVGASRLAILATIVTSAGFGVAGAYFVLRSRRKIRELESELAKQSARTNAAESANRSKTEFLTGMSHQIRTPLKAIIGLTDLTLKSDLSPALRECLDTLRTSADWLRRVAIEAGALELESVPFSVSECVHSTIKLALPDASAKKLTLTCRLDQRLPERVQGDSVYLQYVMFKLLERAVHFTNRGSVQLSVGIKAETKDAVMIRVAVEVTGMRSTAATGSSTSEPCQSMNSDALPKRPDSGVGLSVAKQIVELMGGAMNAETQLGAGSPFEFTARLGKVANIQKEAPEKVLIQGHSTQSGLRIVAAEDGTLDRELITTVLEPAGCHDECAGDGKDAVASAKSEAYELVTTDVDMPATESSQTDHLAASGFAEEPSAEDTARWLDEDMDEFIRKPVDELLLQISDLNRASVPHPEVALVAGASVSGPADEPDASLDANSKDGPPSEVIQLSVVDVEAASMSPFEETLDEIAQPPHVNADEPVVRDPMPTTLENDLAFESRNSAEYLDVVYRSLDKELNWKNSISQDDQPFYPEPRLSPALQNSEAAVPLASNAANIAVVEGSQDLTASESEERSKELADEDSAPMPVTAHMTVPAEQILGASAALLRLAQLPLREYWTPTVPGLISVANPDTQPMLEADWNPFEQARKALFKSRFDVRVIHQDGDPSNRNLI